MTTENKLRDEIRLKEKNKGKTNYCIKAGAGAGKTTILSERISRQLIDDAIPAEQFLVITYTNTAAAELRQKISDELNKIINSGSDTEKTKAKEVLGKLDLMQISTIHSFLFQLLREYAFESGVIMDVQLLDDEAEEQRRIDFFNEWYLEHSEEIHSNGLSDNDWLKVTKAGKFSNKEREAYQDSFFSIANIRDKIKTENPESRENVHIQLEPLAKILLDDLIALKCIDESDAHPITGDGPQDYETYASFEKILSKTEEILPLSGKTSLSSEEIKSIVTVYDAFRNLKTSLYKKLENADIAKMSGNSFVYPIVNNAAADSIDQAIKERKKNGDDPILAMESSAKDLLEDLIALKYNHENHRPQTPDERKPAEPTKSGEGLLKAIREYSGLTAKTALELKDIIVIREIYKLFFGRSENIYKDVDDNLLVGLPQPKSSEFETIETILDYQISLRTVDYVCKIQKAYQDRIENEALFISNDDILYRSKKLLENPRHISILDELRNRYTKIYLDEFQDTTPTQTAIMKMLASKPGTPAVDSISKFTPDTNKLFVVGDPKQSIYRFTGAEKTIFNGIYSEFEKMPDTETQSVELNLNFRSNTDIVNWVNDSFKHWSPKYMVTDWTVSAPNTLHGVFRYAVPNNDLSNYDDVSAVVNLIDRLVGKTHCLIENDRHTKKTRPIRYSDITVIFKNTSNMNDYIKAFSERANPIPVNVHGKYDVSDDIILKNFVILLDFFANPKNKAKKVIAAQVISNADMIKYDAKTSQNMLDDISNNVFRKNRMNSASIVQYLYSHEDLFLPEGTLEEWKVRQYKIRLHQMIEKCLANNDGDLKSLVDSMDKYLTQKIDHEIKLDSETDAVKLINVHKVKGMSEQIVIIADRSFSETNPRMTGFRGNDDCFYPSVSYAVTDRKKEYYPTYQHNPALMDEFFGKVREDLMCLQYVAATRAKNALIIMPLLASEAWFSDYEFHYDTLPLEITEWLADQEKNSTGSDIPYVSPKRSDVITSDDLSVELSNVTSALSERQLISISPSSLETDEQTGYKKDTDENKPGYCYEERPSNSVFGTVMHRTFELLVERRNSIVDDKSKEEQINRAINQAIIESCDDIRTSEYDNCSRYFNFLHDTLTIDSYYDRILALVEGADEVYTEFDFSFFVPDEERDWFMNTFKPYLDDKKISIPDETPIWINGQADLVVKKGNNLTVYDYKSDKRNGKPLADFIDALGRKYAGQLELYAYAVGKSYESTINKIDASIIHLYINTEM